MNGAEKTQPRIYTSIEKMARFARRGRDLGWGLVFVLVATAFPLVQAMAKGTSLPPRKPDFQNTFPQPGRSYSSLISRVDAKAVRAVYKALDRNRFKDALNLMRRVEDPLLGRVVLWSYLSAPYAPVTFNALVEFIKRHPDWPKRKTLLRRAEIVMPVSMPKKDVLSWFKTMGGPFSIQGRVRAIEARLALANTPTERQHVIKALRAVWVNGDFSKALERRFYRRHKRLLTRGDHKARLERLLWDEKYWPARRQVWRVGVKERKLAHARLWLMRREGNVDKAIGDLKKIAPQLLNQPGLVYERLRWRRRKGRIESAAKLFAKAPGDPVRPGKWWLERADIARSFLERSKALRGREKRAKLEAAYAIVNGYGLTPGSVVDYSDAQWMSGWIALRFLKEPKRALSHFTRMFAVVSSPISRARGAYWAGRAEDALQQPQKAGVWLQRAARYSTTYYGQLARVRLKRRGAIVPARRAAPFISARLARIFARHPMKVIAQMLVEAGEKDRIDAFIRQLSDADVRPAWQALSARYAASLGRPDLAIRIAKASARRGAPLGNIAYPAFTPPQPARFKNAGGVEPSLVLAVIRQESAFYQDAISRTGARGLMQVMPATARRIAKSNRLPYDRERLITDAKYNLIIGQMYLSGMVNAFDGSYPLALAAYNAGPYRVRRWIKTFGDPRKTNVDLIDWMELIPFGETRNYVQRVLENLEVYRTLFNPPALLKSKDVL